MDAITTVHIMSTQQTETHISEEGSKTQYGHRLADAWTQSKENCDSLALLTDKYKTVHTV